MELQLKPEFTYWASLDAPIAIGGGPFGQRMYFPVTGGEAAGDRFNARAVGGGGDWIIVGPDGYGRVDVRIQFTTDDDAHVYLQYFGLLELNATVMAAMATGASTTFEDQYFRTTPRAETGDPRYAWMNQTVFVARGRVREGGGVEYEVSSVL